MYDPQTQRIVVSRDVVFDETKGWNWHRTNAEQSMAGEFKITLSEFGNHGINEDKWLIEEAAEVGSSNRDAQVSNDITSSVIDLEEEDEGEEEEQVTLRRSQRESVKPKYLEDYVLLAEEEGDYLLMCLNDEPHSFEEAK